MGRKRGFGGRNNDHRSRGLGREEGVTGQRRSARQSQNAKSLNDMLVESRDVVGVVEVGGGRDEDSTDIRGKNAATAGVAGATLFVPND